VVLLGLATVILGAMYALVGATLLYAGVHALGQLPGDEQQSGWAPVLAAVMGFVVVFGVALLVQGVPQVVAGMGVMLRRPWARVLTLVMAVPTALWGIVLLATGNSTASTIVLGVVQVAYGVLAWAALMSYGTEFSRERV
jgi:hypothetical protein